MIGAIIQKKRKEAGLTQAQLADLLNITAPAVNRWEKGLSFPDATLLAPLARCLKTDLNELFSFYDSLTDNERKRIVDKATTMLLLENESEALAYIDDVIRNNLSDGKLYLDLAKVLLGAHAFRKTTNPMIYLDKIAEFYERAMKLLPEQTTDISHSLITIYAEMGNIKKAEESWSRLPDKSYDKKWAHAEMLYETKNYDAAIPEIRRLVLERIIGLSQNLVFLGNALYLSGDSETSVIAQDLDSKLRDLFGLWHGMDVINRTVYAIETRIDNAVDVMFSDLLADDFSHEKITTCPLFKGVELGGADAGDRSTGDLMANILTALQNLSNKTNT